VFHGFTSSLAGDLLTTELSVATVSQRSQQPPIRNGLSAYLHACGISLHSTRADWLVFRFSRCSLCTYPTENAVPLLMWVTWSQVFYCNCTILLAPLIPAALLLLRDIIAVTDSTHPSVACVIVALMSSLATFSSVLVSQ
jgi:hypothetical protein